MTPFEIYKYYLAVKRHFNSDYDAFKYNFKVTATPSSFEKRPDRFFFEKLARQPDPKNFILANLIHNPNSYVRDLTQNHDCLTIYAKWVKTNQSLNYTLVNDLAKIKDNFNSSFICVDKEHPLIIKLYITGEITLETLCILCNLTHCLDYWDKRLKGDIVYDDLKVLIKKYTPFINFDKKTVKKLIKAS